MKNTQSAGIVRRVEACNQRDADDDDGDNEE